jgi:hypothetical protein
LGKQIIQMSETAPIFLIIVDEDRKQFTVEGPLREDSAWKSAINKARDDGRNIKSCEIGSTSRSDAVAEWQRHYGLFYRLVEPGNIVLPQSERRRGARPKRGRGL